jgi:hypothetical protein
MESEFKPKSEEHAAHIRWAFVCPACKTPDFVDETTGLCRPCWRALVLVREVLREELAASHDHPIPYTILGPK